MPLYEYECGACGNRFELIQKFSDDPVEVCPKCGERKVHKLMSSPAFQFKGSGWYITDYARKGGSGESKPDDKGSSEKGDKSATSEKSEKSEKSAKSEKSEKSEKSDKPASTSSNSGSPAAPSGSTDKSS